MSRGNSKTDGFKSRTLPLGGKVARLLGTRREELHRLAQMQMSEIDLFDKALAYALALAAAGGDREKIKKSIMDTRLTRARNSIAQQTKSSSSAFGRDSPHRRVAARLSTPKGSSSPAPSSTRRERSSSSALPAMPCAGLFRPRAEARARSAFEGKVGRRPAALPKTRGRGRRRCGLKARSGKYRIRLLRLDPGSLAELRRMGTGGAGPLAFWRLAAECGFLDDPSELWRPIVQIFAILTPRGDRLATDRLHNARRRLGAVLCDGGDPVWPRRPRVAPLPLGNAPWPASCGARRKQRGDAWTRNSPACSRQTATQSLRPRLLRNRHVDFIRRRQTRSAKDRFKPITAGSTLPRRNPSQRKLKNRTASRFIQIHTLHSYAVCPIEPRRFGPSASGSVSVGCPRTRISSQCLKRHWRMARVERDGKIIKDDPYALQNLSGYVDLLRSRELVTEKVIGPLKGRFSDDVVTALEPEFQRLCVRRQRRQREERSPNAFARKTGICTWSAKEAERMAATAGDAGGVKKAVAEWVKDKNYKAMTQGAALPGGLIAALFGRMVTSDPAANIDAPVHVAHAFTVHGEEAEGDYFTAVDDLKKDDDDSGAETILRKPN